MTSRETAYVEITPEVLLKAYACGIFPMAESAEDPTIHWREPAERLASRAISKQPRRRKT